MIYFKTLRTLLSYLFLGLFLAAPALPLLPFIGVSQWALNGWHAIDVTICSWAHGTRYRSISGWAGQHQQDKRRYYYIAVFVDAIFLFLAKEVDHCRNTFLDEKSKGLVKDT
jgi:hypothetical protein